MVQEQWVIGGYDVQSKVGFMVPVDRRDAATLLPIIRQHILPGTTIMSDLWAAYNTQSNQGFIYLTVNHSYNFVNSVTGAYRKCVAESQTDPQTVVRHILSITRHVLGRIHVKTKIWQQF